MNTRMLTRPRIPTPADTDRTNPRLAAALMDRAALLTDDPDLQRIAEDIRRHPAAGARS